MKFLNFFFLCILSISVHPWGGWGAQLNVWPLPLKYSNGNESVAIDETNFQISCEKSSKICSPFMERAFNRYHHLIFFAKARKYSNENPAKKAFVLHVSVEEMPPLALHVDESYSLIVSQSGAILKSKTTWGLLRGLETFSQLVNWTPQDGYSISSLPILVEDEPRFPWRGLMIDTARHYLPLSTIQRALDAMSFNKMNVLHWHVTDSQSFPIVSNVYPYLSDKGAWRKNAIYSQQDVRSIIEYAKDRGIRVVAEFDTPGHADCWGNGYPDLFPNCPGNRPVFNPITNYTLNFMHNFLNEMMNLFVDEFIHLGGDEVTFECWEADSSISKWMKDNKVSSYEDLQGYYEKKLEGIVIKQKKNAIYWDEVFGNELFPLDTSSVIQVWNKPQEEVVNVIKAGYRSLYSSSWYLDRQIPGAQTYYLWEDTWKDFYSADPIGNYSLNPEELKRVLGGEACMWGEQVDETDFDVRVWPRACAIGERLWSPQYITDIDSATPRLGTHRCRMVRRGIMAGPIYPDYCDTGRNQMRHESKTKPCQSRMVHYKIQYNVYHVR